MGSVSYVVEREIREKLRDRAFLIFTAFMLALVVGLPIGAYYLDVGGSDSPEGFSVAVAGDGSGQIGEVLRQQGEAAGPEVELRQTQDVAAARSLVTEGEADAAVIDGQSAFVGEGGSEQLVSMIQSSAGSLQTAEVLQQTGANPQQIQAAQNPAPLSVERQEAEGGVPQERQLVAYLGVFLLFISVYLYGYWVSNGIVEEKSSRVAEVVVSATKTWHLLVGKVIGLGLLGLGQLLVLGVIGLVAASFLEFELPEATWSVGGIVLLWFVLGYALYSALFAVSGSIVSRHEELQYTQLPIMAPLFIGFFVAIDNLGDPSAPLVEVLSFVPPFTPLLMMVRMSLGEVAVVEILAAIALTVVAIAATMWVANRLYRGSILRFGSRVKLAEAWRSAAKTSK